MQFYVHIHTVSHFLIVKKLQRKVGIVRKSIIKTFAPDKKPDMQIPGRHKIPYSRGNSYVE